MKTRLLSLALVVLSCLTAMAGLTANQVAGSAQQGSIQRQRGSAQGRKVRRVIPCATSGAVSSLREVSFEGGGFAVVDAADPKCKVLAFSERGQLEKDETSPLWKALCKHKETQGEAMNAMDRLTSGGAATFEALLERIEALTSDFDIRVDPFVNVHWGQTYAGSQGTNLCYNYYTPEHYPCGCVVVAMAQIMRYHKWPAASKAAATYSCGVGGKDTVLTMIGGAYDWVNMAEEVDSDAPEAVRMAIGKLTYDCGVAMRTQYSNFGSESYARGSIVAFTNDFCYASAHTLDRDLNVMSNVQNAVLSNLDAKCPVLLDFSDEAGSVGHTVVADGYGYVGDTCYVHLNAGKAGKDDAWYALPEVNAASQTKPNLVASVSYNIFPENAGAVVSGRVTLNGEGASGCAVSFYAEASGTDACVTTRTDAHGVYAAVLDEAKSYRVVATIGGVSQTNEVETGISRSYKKITWNSFDEFYASVSSLSSPMGCGNRWGNDFAFRKRLAVEMAFPELPPDATEDEVRRTVANIGFADGVVADGIGGVRGRYDDFRKWAYGLNVSIESVVSGRKTWLSFLLRRILREPVLLSDEAEPEFRIVRFAPNVGSKIFTLTVRLADRGESLPLADNRQFLAGIVCFGTSPSEMIPLGAQCVNQVTLREDGCVDLEVEAPGGKPGFFGIKVK